MRCGTALIKTGTSRLGAMVILSMCEVPIGLGVALLPRGAQHRSSALGRRPPAVTHFFYKFFLTYAYERGDLSRVYPIARGTAPLVVALASGLVLADSVTTHRISSASPCWVLASC